MKKIFGIFTFLALIMFLAVPTLAKDQRSTRIVTVPEGQVLNQSFYVNGGEYVTISGEVNGDVIVAGGNVLITGVVNGDVLAAGGTVSIPGTVSQDVRVVGGQISIRGTVDGNITAVGGSVEISDDSFVAGGVLAVSGNTFVSADILGDAIFVGGNTVIDNATISGNVETYSETANIGPDVIVGGNLTYATDSQTTISKDASISGQMNTKTLPQSGWETRSQRYSPNMGERVFSSILAFAMVSLVGLVLLKLFPQLFETTSRMVKSNHAMTFLKGLAAVILWPIASVLVLFTVIGIPLGALSLAVYAMLLYISKLFVAYPIGEMLLAKRTKKKNMYLSLVTGLAVYYLIRVLPLIGGLTALVVTLYGMGLFVVSFRSLSKKS